MKNPMKIPQTSIKDSPYTGSREKCCSICDFRLFRAFFRVSQNIFCMFFVCWHMFAFFVLSCIFMHLCILLCMCIFAHFFCALFVHCFVCVFLFLWTFACGFPGSGLSALPSCEGAVAWRRPYDEEDEWEAWDRSKGAKGSAQSGAGPKEGARL